MEEVDYGGAQLCVLTLNEKMDIRAFLELSIFCKVLYKSPHQLIFLILMTSGRRTRYLIKKNTATAPPANRASNVGKVNDIVQE